MVITNEHFSVLSKVYMTLLEVQTKGENTLIMADCLRALSQTLIDIENTQQKTTTQEG